MPTFSIHVRTAHHMQTNTNRSVSNNLHRSIPVECMSDLGANTMISKIIQCSIVHVRYQKFRNEKTRTFESRHSYHVAVIRLAAFYTSTRRIKIWRQLQVYMYHTLTIEWSPAGIMCVCIQVSESSHRQAKRKTKQRNRCWRNITTQHLLTCTKIWYSTTEEPEEPQWERERCKTWPRVISTECIFTDRKIKVLHDIETEMHGRAQLQFFFHLCGLIKWERWKAQKRLPGPY